MASVAAGSRAADRLLDTLESWGVTHVFTCPGSTEAAFLQAAAGHPTVKVLLTTHEAIAVSAADGFARATGRPSVAYLHTNVGLANGVGHLYAAQLAHSPVVVLTGLKSTAIQGRGGFTTAPSMRDFVRQYVKWDWQALTPASIPEDVNRALKIACAEPAGPTWVGISQDLIEAEVSGPAPDASRFSVPARTRPAPQELQAAARLLTSSPRVVIVAGADVARSGGVPELVRLAEALGATVLTEDRRTLDRTVFPAEHPCYAGMYAATRQCVQAADVVFFAGARSFVEFEPAREPEVPTSASVIQLYSDAAEVAKLYGVDVPLVGDATLSLGELADLVGSGQPRPEAEAFLAAARAEHTRMRDAVLVRQGPPGESLRVPDVMVELAQLVDDNVTVIGDATTSGGALLYAMEGSGGARVTTTSSGSLGWGVGAALGTALAEPDRRVLAVLGDGVFQFGMPGLWTAVRYGIPVTFVVINNQSYAAVGAAIRRYAGGLSDAERALVVDLQGPRIADIAAGFGVPSQRITDLSELGPLVRKGLSATGPSLIEVMTDTGDLGP
jgi:benzoylformate decarboxylase